MKCRRCGKEIESDLGVCENCGYDYYEDKKLQKIFKVKKENVNVTSTDLIDYPILTFIFGLISLILPIYIFSFLAIKLSKKPSKANLLPFKNLGKVFGIFGIFVSTFLLFYILFTFIF